MTDSQIPALAGKKTTALDELRAFMRERQAAHTGVKDFETFEGCDADYPCVWNGQKGATTCGGEHVVGLPEVYYCPLLGGTENNVKNCVQHACACNLNELCCNSGDVCVVAASGRSAVVIENLTIGHSRVLVPA